jgi:hypothetical protein
MTKQKETLGGRKVSEQANLQPRENGVAHRFPPHSMTRPKIASRLRKAVTVMDCAGRAVAATALSCARRPSLDRLPFAGSKEGMRL